jgi:hypothetical protein
MVAVRLRCVLIVTAVNMQMLTEHTDLSHSIVIRWTRRVFPVTDGFRGEHFVVRAAATAAQQSAVPGAKVRVDVAVPRASRVCGVLASIVHKKPASKDDSAPKTVGAPPQRLELERYETLGPSPSALPDGRLWYRIVGLRIPDLPDTTHRSGPANWMS